MENLGVELENSTDEINDLSTHGMINLLVCKRLVVL
jgi:hypothetical protein